MTELEIERRLVEKLIDKAQAVVTALREWRGPERTGSSYGRLVMAIDLLDNVIKTIER